MASFEALRDSMEKNVTNFAFSGFFMKPEEEWVSRAAMYIGIYLYN